MVARHLGELALESPVLPGLAVFIRGLGAHRRAGASSRTHRRPKRDAPEVAMMMGFEAGQISKYEANEKSQD